MTKTLRVALLSGVLAFSASPLFAGDPGGNDPPPPPGNGGGQAVVVSSVFVAVVASLGL
jgi:hypothetical protein